MKKSIKIILSLCLITGFFSCQVQTITVRYEGKLSERYQVKRKTQERHGYHKVYHENRRVSLEETYVDGQLQGSVKTYYEDGALESIVNTDQGKFNGSFVYYFNNGNLMQEGYYINDEMSGALRTYYENGQLKEVVTMKKSDEVGPFREYAATGVLLAEGRYVSKGERTALEEGLLYIYDEKTRKLVKKMRCKEGFCCTIWTLEGGYIEPKNDLCRDIINQKEVSISTISTSSD